MENFMAPAIVLCVALCISVLLLDWLLRIGRELFAWWVFFLLAFPSLTILLSLFIYDWQDRVSVVTIQRMLAQGFGTMLAISFLSSVGLLVPVYRAIGMLTVLFFLANSKYIFGIRIFDTEFPGNLPIFFGSIIVIGIYAFLNRDGYSKSPKVERTAPVDVKMETKTSVTTEPMFHKQPSQERTSMPYATPRDRIAQVLYVVGALISLFFAFILTLNVVIDGEFLEEAVFLYPLCIASYGIGWALRWIINGTSTSVIDYIRQK